MGKILLNIGRIVLILLVLCVAYIVFYFKPTIVEEPALTALKSGSGVEVSIESDLITFKPTTQTETALIFYPGGLVDARAYAYTMRAYAEKGIAVYLVKMPYNFSSFAGNRASDIIGQHPEIKNWFLGGHSQGGVDGSSYAVANAGKLKGLILYASYPAADVSNEIKDLPVLSLSGSKDNLVKPAKIESTKKLLPANTQYVVLDGMIHSYFGEYGPQPNDGQATISREEARSKIIDETVKFIEANS